MALKIGSTPEACSTTHSGVYFVGAISRRSAILRHAHYIRYGGSFRLATPAITSMHVSLNEGLRRLASVKKDEVAFGIWKGDHETRRQLVLQNDAQTPVFDRFNRHVEVVNRKQDTFAGLKRHDLRQLEELWEAYRS